MRFVSILAAGLLAPITALAAPAGDASLDVLNKRENLCSLKAPPVLCTPNANITAEETAIRAYKFYRAFVVDGDPKTMFSLIDNEYIQHNPGYKSGPQAIWSLFCSGRKIGTEASTSWCYVPSTGMSYAKYATIDRWRWVGGCVHEHWDQGEKFPSADQCVKLPAGAV